MIGYLQGTVLAIEEKTILVSTTGGVGYSVFPAGSLLAQCAKGKSFEAFIYTVVRETELSLYGFAEKSEKDLFTKLISISGIGPKIGLQIVASPIADFMSAIERGDDAFIAQTPGIGKKMAQKLIVELQGKLDLSSASQGGTMSPALSEATAALQNLGYDAATIAFVLKKAPAGGSTEDLVKYFLSSNA